ncbi:unannotated protein [freshwater metagenome]|uniref:Unannotated protein n=1 Tax=freshwater metagenome TaxID=449393 RepID=A0A6J7KKJ7_9ZZZZ
MEDDTFNNNDEFTVASEPPTCDRRQRRSRWAALFAECRSRPGEWRQIREPMKPSSAHQIASDLRSAHRRAPDKSRMRGILLGDRWETVADTLPGESTDQVYVWLRFVGHQQAA